MDGTDWGIVLGFGGIAATVIVSAVTLFLQNRGTEARLRNENRQAHAAIGESIRDTAAGLERKFNTRFDAVETEIAGIKVEIADIKDRGQRRLRAMIDAEL